jgi:hypothetical protein
MTQRYTVQYSAHPKWDYALLDTETMKYVFGSNSKSEVIAAAQERNGYAPIDGDEQTYAKQTGGT